MLTTSPSATTLRPFSTTIGRLNGKGEDHRSTIDTRSSEYTSSGYDSDVADNSEAAFDGKETTPEGAKAKFQKKNNGSPLEFSGANRNISGSPIEKKTSDKTDHPDRDRSVSSGGKKKHGLLKQKNDT